MDVSVRSQANISVAGLSKSKYYLKPLDKFFCSKGDMDSSVLYYLRVMKHLFETIETKYRDYILFPLCVRVEGKETIGGQILFEYLDASWCIGLPDSEEQRKDYMDSLRCAMDAIHRAGVVHMDLYLSNIMWRTHPADCNRVSIKIIDWDAAHFITDEFDRVVLERLSGLSGRTALAQKLGASKSNYDVSLLDVIVKHVDDRSLRVRTKIELDIAFRSCVEAEYRM